MVARLSPTDIEHLRTAPFTYACVGGTASGEIENGYRPFTRTALVSRLSFDEAVDRLMTWRVQELSGLRVATSAARVMKDEVVVMRLGLGAAALRIPCRVVHVVDEPDRIGFAYGTLPGHPESGEEQFVLERVGDEVRFSIQAFSRPNSRLAKLSGPIGRQFQEFMTIRYLRAAGA